MRNCIVISSDAFRLVLNSLYITELVQISGTKILIFFILISLIALHSLVLTLLLLGLILILCTFLSLNCTLLAAVSSFETSLRELLHVLVVLLRLVLVLSMEIIRI